MATHLANSLRRSFKIRRASLFGSVAGLCNDRPPTVIGADESCRASSSTSLSSIAIISDDEIRRLYSSQLDDLIENDSLKAQLMLRPIEQMRALVTLQLQSTQNVCSDTPSSLISDLLKHGKGSHKCQKILDRIFISIKNGTLSQMRQFIDKDLSSLIDFLVSFADDFIVRDGEKCRHTSTWTIQTLCLGIRIVHAVSSTGIGFNRLSTDQPSLYCVMHFVCTVQNKFNGIEQDFLNSPVIDDIRRANRVSIDLLTVFLYQSSSVVLGNLNASAKSFGVSRFQFIVDGLQFADTDDLKVRYLNLLSSLFTCKEGNVYHRIQIQSELAQLGLFRYLQKLYNESAVSEGGNLLTAIDGFRRLVCVDNAASVTGSSGECGDIGDQVKLFKTLLDNTRGSVAEMHLTSILYHLILIQNYQPAIRDSFIDVFNTVISRTIRTKCGMNVDCQETVPQQLSLEDIADIITRSGPCSSYGGSTITLEDTRSLSSCNTNPCPSSITSADLHGCTIDECTISEVEKTLCPGSDRSGSAEKRADRCDTPLTFDEDYPPPPPCPGLPENMVAGPIPPPPPLLLGLPGADKCSHLKPRMRYHHNRNLKKVNWSRINARKIHEDSLWAQIDESLYADRSFCALLDNEFAIETVKVTAKQPIPNENSSLLKFLDIKTGQHLAILLNYLKVSPNTLAQWIYEGSHDAVSLSTLQQVQKYIQILPTLSETDIKLYEESKDLQVPERFLLLLTKMPLLPQRIELMIFIKRFYDQTDECLELMDSGVRACREIRCSKEFATFVGLLLAAGNYLNSSTNSCPSAYGFGFDFLVKAYDTKCSSGRTLLHLILSALRKHSGQSAITALLDLQAISEAAAKLDTTDVQTFIIDIQNGRQRVVDFLGLSSNFENDAFADYLKEFLCQIEIKLEELNSRYAEVVCEQRTLASFLSFEAKETRQFFTVLYQALGHVKQCKAEVDKTASDKLRAQNCPVPKRARLLKKKQQKLSSRSLLVEEDDIDVVDKLLDAVTRYPTTCSSS